VERRIEASKVRDSRIDLLGFLDQPKRGRNMKGGEMN